MKKIIYLIPIILITLLSSCSDNYETKSELIVDRNVNKKDKLILSKTDTTQMNKDVVYSEDGKLAYIIEKREGGLEIVEKIKTKGETVEVVDWSGTIILFIFLFYVFKD